MPAKKHVKVVEGVSWAIWEITEEYEELFAQLPLDKNDYDHLEGVSYENKRLEYLAGRIAVKQLMVREGLLFEGIFKDFWGKPHLVNSDLHISLSNTYPYAAAMLNMNGPAGIDMEKITPKPLKIAHKFLSSQELDWAGTDVLALNILWCAKEALYKVFGKKRLSFRHDIALEKFHPAGAGVLTGMVFSDGSEQQHQLHYLQWEEYIICYNI